LKLADSGAALALRLADNPGQLFPAVGHQSWLGKPPPGRQRINFREIEDVKSMGCPGRWRPEGHRFFRRFAAVSLKPRQFSMNFIFAKRPAGDLVTRSHLVIWIEAG